MLVTERVLLRYHVEAVWGVQLPPLIEDECELLPTGKQPSWRLYVADIATARIHIWRPDVSSSERARLRVAASPISSSASPVLVGVSREVALSFSAEPALDLASARRIARPLDQQDQRDQSLIEVFQPDSDLLEPVLRPVIGVIEAGRLLCVAHSSRRSAVACELGIETLSPGRRKGYALAATVLWTQLILREGLVPIYSAFAENTASLNLAAKSGYRAFAHGATCP